MRIVSFFPTPKQFLISIIAGILIGNFLVYLPKLKQLFHFQTREKPARVRADILPREMKYLLYGVTVRKADCTKISALSCPYVIEETIPEEQPRLAVLSRLERPTIVTPLLIRRPATGVPRTASKQPNIIRLARAEAIPPVSAIVVRGHLACAKKHDHPHRSHKNPWGELDLECCLDPDEIPNPYCDYSIKI